MKENINSLKAIKTLTITGMLIALSAIGALVKVFNTVAFDSMAGYFAALYLGNFCGAIVISLGHLLTAITSGFPLGIPIHLYIAVQMAIYAILFGLAYKRSNSIIAIGLGTLLNGPISALSLVPILGWGFFIGWSLPLALGSFVNILLATLVYKGMIMKSGDKFDRKI